MGCLKYISLAAMDKINSETTAGNVESIVEGEQSSGEELGDENDSDKSERASQKLEDEHSVSNPTKIRWKNNANSATTDGIVE
jgi:hypothetical protein